MTSALIGHTGFVGTNLKTQHQFTDFYNSQNINTIQGKSYDVVVCSGIPASMWLANTNPQKDLENIEALLKFLKTISAKRFILISSTAVLAQPVKQVNESTSMFEKTLAYGKHRHYAEVEIEKYFDKSLIVRIPALFGLSLKKNLIYDLLNQEPAFMPYTNFENLMDKLIDEEEEVIRTYYKFDEANNRYVFNKKKAVDEGKRKAVLSIFKNVNFTALKFTHSESVFQFYNLKNLWRDIGIAIDNNLKILHLCSEPLSANTIAQQVFAMNFENDNGKPPFDYNMHTKHAHLWSKDIPYQYSKEEVLAELKTFVNEYK